MTATQPLPPDLFDRLSVIAGDMQTAWDQAHAADTFPEEINALTRLRDTVDQYLRLTVQQQAAGA